MKSTDFFLHRTIYYIKNHEENFKRNESENFKYG